MELETEDCLKRRMQENCTYGSVRGSDIPFHATKIMRGVSSCLLDGFHMKFSEQQLREYIVNILLEGDIIKKNDELPEIYPDTDLQDIGMNSILFIQFIVFLETTYSMEINDDDLLMEKFVSINQIIKTMDKYDG